MDGGLAIGILFVILVSLFVLLCYLTPMLSIVFGVLRFIDCRVRRLLLELGLAIMVVFANHAGERINSASSEVVAKPPYIV
jgi:hypothetical protein